MSYFSRLFVQYDTHPLADEYIPGLADFYRVARLQSTLINARDK